MHFRAKIWQTEYNLHLLLKIKEFLILNLGFDKYSTYKLRCSSVISINKQKARLGKPSVTFVIQNINRPPGATFRV